MKTKSEDKQKMYGWHEKRKECNYDPVAMQCQTPAMMAERITKCQCNGAGFVRVWVPVGHPLFGQAIPCCCGENQGSGRT